MTSNNNLQTGKIIFYKGHFGFIELPSGDTFYFKNKSLLKTDSPKDVKLLDHVTCKTGITETGLHKGKPFAYDISFVKRGSFNEYKRLVGRLVKWKKYSGLLESPKLEKRVKIFSTRLTGVNFRDVKEGDIMIAHVVNSSVEDGKLFAFFAYPLQIENDPAFLRKQYSESQLSEIFDQLLNVLFSLEQLSLQEQLIYAIQAIGKINSSSQFQVLKELLFKFENQYGKKVTWEMLEGFVETKFLILLWESESIKNYDLGVMKKYFIQAKADKKRKLIVELKNHKDEIINHYYSFLLESEGLNKSNNELKTFLSVLALVPKYPDYLLYKNFKKHILESFHPKEIIQLWVYGYIDSLQERFIIDYFDVLDLKFLHMLLKSADKREILEKVLEEYILNYIQNIGTKKIEPIIFYLHLFQKEFPKRFSKITNAVRVELNPCQNFILSIFGIEIGFDVNLYFIENYNSINHYFLLRYFLNKKELSTSDEDLIKTNAITQEGLKKFALKYSWNSFLSRTEIEPMTTFKSYFLLDVRNFIHRFSNKEIDLRSIGEALFRELPSQITKDGSIEIEHFSVHHIRLWLYSYVSEDRFSYLGFRNAFKLLFPVEQKEFKKKSRPLINKDLAQREKETIVPCIDFEELENGNNRYNATVENIFFMRNEFYLLKEDGIQTEIKKDTLSRSGFNRIPPNHELFNFVFPLDVNDENKIVTKKPLVNFIKDIEFREIDLTELDKPIPENPNKKKMDEEEENNKGYTEDMFLKEVVHEYLEEQQVKEIAIDFLFEPKYYFRVKEDNEKDYFLTDETISLYTINTSDGYIIVWENKDYSADRATFIFKTTKEEYLKQITKIKIEISNRMGLRSNLISSSKDYELQLFRRNLGYIASIRKRRGKEDAFTSWKNNFEKAIKKEIPSLLKENEVNILENWTPDMDGLPETNTSRFIDTNTFGKMDTSLLGGKKNTKTVPPIKKQRQSILDALKRFNN